MHPEFLPLGCHLPPIFNCFSYSVLFYALSLPFCLISLSHSSISFPPFSHLFSHFQVNIFSFICSLHSFSFASFFYWKRLLVNRVVTLEHPYVNLILTAYKIYAHSLFIFLLSPVTLCVCLCVCACMCFHRQEKLNPATQSTTRPQLRCTQLPGK